MKIDKQKISRSRAEIKAESFERRNTLLAFIEANGPMGTILIYEGLGFPKSVILQWLYSMIESGHVQMHQVTDGRRINIWSRGLNTDPLELIHLGGFSRTIKDPQITRKCVKAKQIGMPPYGDLPKGFFGQVFA